MKNIVLSLMLVVAVGCSPSTETVKLFKGDSGTNGTDGTNGTSCGVAPALDSETSLVIGATISCTDGSFATIYNGLVGPQGLTGEQGSQGVQGLQGIQGPQGSAGHSCQAYRSNLFDGVFLSCPGQLPQLISDGRDGSNGRDGTSCSSTRQESQSRVKITCGNNTTYVYDGKDGTNGTNGTNGKNGTSCTAVAASGGANIVCGNNTPVFLANGAQGPAGTPGTPGAAGAAGQPGRDGLNGTNGEDAIQPGVSCNVHDLKSWDGNTSLPQALVNNPVIGTFTLANFSVGDSQASAGFPGMPADLQAKVGYEGYALDCSGFLNVPTTGTYAFDLFSDDGSYLAIEDQVVIQNQGLHAPQSATGSAALYRGPNRINVVYYQGPYSQIALQLKWSGPNTASQVVPASNFTQE